MPPTPSPTRSAPWLPRLLLAAWLGLLAAPCRAMLPPDAFRFEHWSLPVRVVMPHGVVVRRDMVVSITRLRRLPARSAPFLVLLHGRPAGAAARVRMGRVELPGNAAYFASLGYVVAVPTRVGYGATGGPDLEDSGACDDEHFAASVGPLVQETAQLVAALARLPQVDPARGVVVGNSFGGLGAIAIASRHLPGIVAAINFSGGDGGSVRYHLDHPCQPWRLQRVYARYGATNRLPTLWLYSANDRLWGPRNPARWFRAFAAAGGRGRYVELPADKNNGHFIFDRNRLDWRAAVLAFLRRHGLPDRVRAAPRARRAQTAGGSAPGGIR